MMPFRLFKFKIVRRRRVRRRRHSHKSHSSYLEHRAQALELVTSRLTYFNTFYNFKYNTIKIKNNSSRWGSCSRKGNLNFNYRIALLPPELADYLVIHELCHLGEFNHSKKFWELVERTVPHWRTLRVRLKKEGEKVF
jgi:predicted metal-dependent hydrolase